MVEMKSNMAVVWDEHQSDRERRASVQLSFSFDAQLTQILKANGRWDMLTDNAIRSWDQIVAIHLRRPALLACFRQKLPKDIVDCIAAFWRQTTCQGFRE